MDIKALLEAMLLLVEIAAVIAFVLYIFGSIGLMGVAKNTQTKGGWMAWFPPLNFYLLIKSGLNKKIAVVALILMIISPSGTSTTTINGVEKTSNFGILPPQIAAIVILIVLIITWIAIYKVYYKLSEKYIAMFVISLLTFGLMVPIFLFAIRNNLSIEDPEFLKAIDDNNEANATKTS